MATSKTLTISVAAYNVEDYIDKTLSSVASSTFIDEIEVFVIDDGGNDRTIEIAQKYADLYPNSIKLVRKENGGYGSTVNYSMKNASGKYLKLLDGDDWYETTNLEKLIPLLKESNADVIVTDYRKCYPNKSEIVTYANFFMPNKELEMDNLHELPIMHMWALMFRTEIVRRMNFTLPEKVFYTDVKFATIPFAGATLLTYFNLPIYNYRCGRDEQSVSKTSKIRHYKDAVIVTRDEVQYYANHKSCYNREYIRDRIAVSYLDSINTLMYLPASLENLEKVITWENELKEMSNEIYNRCLHCSAGKRMALVLRLLRLSKYKLYWIFKKTNMF